VEYSVYMLHVFYWVHNCHSVTALAHLSITLKSTMCGCTVDVPS